MPSLLEQLREMTVVVADTGDVEAVKGSEQEQFEIVRGLYQPKTATADLMVMPPSGLRRI
ncbi:MAG: hypothetical protein R3D34_00135 [Nitratireductor sp.]